MSSNHRTDHLSDQPTAPDALVLPLERLDRRLLPVVGGKAAALGELIHAGFAVPGGFCVTTTAYAYISESARVDALLAELSAVPTTDTARQGELAAQVRAAIVQTPIPGDITSAIET